MSTAAVAVRPATRTPLTLAEDACAECGGVLAENDEHLCAGCRDLEAHAWCRECGAVLADADLDAGACSGCGS